MTTDTTATVSPLGKLIQDKVGTLTYQTAGRYTAMDGSQRHSTVRDAEHYTNSVDIKGAVYETAIDALDALWLVKYGNEWVTDVQFNENFWEVAAERLNQMGRLEKHYLTDRACYVYRIPK
jgi:uncharacterized protein YraI